MCLCGEGSAVRNLTYLCVCRLARSLPLYRGKIYGSGGRDPIWCWFDCAITSHYVGWHWAASQAKLEWWVLAVWVKAIIYLCYRCKSHGMDRVHPKLLQLVANNTKRISQGGGGEFNHQPTLPSPPLSRGMVWECWNPCSESLPQAGPWTGPHVHMVQCSVGPAPLVTLRPGTRESGWRPGVSTV